MRWGTAARPSPGETTSCFIIDVHPRETGSDRPQPRTKKNSEPPRNDTERVVVDFHGRSYHELGRSIVIIQANITEAAGAAI